MKKFMRWFFALLCASISLRVVIYLGLSIMAGSVELFDWVAGVPIGLVSAYLSYMFFKRIFKSGQIYA